MRANCCNMCMCHVLDGADAWVVTRPGDEKNANVPGSQVHSPGACVLRRILTAPENRADLIQVRAGNNLPAGKRSDGSRRAPLSRRRFITCLPAGRCGMTARQAGPLLSVVSNIRRRRGASPPNFTPGPPTRGHAKSNFLSVKTTSVQASMRAIVFLETPDLQWTLRSFDNPIRARCLRFLRTLLKRM